MALKYIVATSLGREEIYLFDSSILHIHFATSMRIPRERIVSAGFVSGSGGDGPVCHGESTSLGVVSRREVDDGLLREKLGQSLAG
ncbi:MAG: hypothetical protein HQL34_13240 [Alphaproteobacteria bacterium]|nr:hypothetical protein [Alphaproteobacteria bacterium]